MTEQELLAVLDMNEYAQIEWLMDKDYMPNYYVGMRGRTHDESLADLAFRLRDEVEQKIGLWWSGAISKVFFHMAHSPERFDLSTEDMKRQFSWFGTKAKPIHWIIAALIAKEKEK